MLRTLSHRISHAPWFYDSVQFLAGSSIVRRRLTALAKRLRPESIILDVGGGTGLYRDIWRRTSLFICMDIETAMLRRFMAKYPKDAPLQADAACFPFRDKRVDVVVCTNVSHHLSNKALASFFQESARVLNDKGILIFSDAVNQPHRPLSRWLWARDRGSHVRTGEQIQSMISKDFRIVHFEKFAFFHQYWLCVGDKGATASLGAD